MNRATPERYLAEDADPVRVDLFAGWSNYRKMMNGIRHDDCTCILICGVRYEGGQAIEPAEFEQNDNCPLHPL